MLVGGGIVFTCKQCKIDGEGRYIFLHCIIENQECILANIYIPPPFKLEVLYCLLEFVVDRPNIPVIVVGDFNVIINKKMDRFPPGNQGWGPQGKRIGQFLEEAGLLDLWRIRNPVAQQFSCYSGSYSTLSRIDLILGNNLASQIIKDIVYQPRGVSDHSLLTAMVNIRNKKLGGLWRMNPIWFELIEGQNEIVGKVKEFIDFNTDTTTRGVMWDALKSYLRGLLIQQVSRTKKKSSEWEVKIRAELAAAEREYLKEPSADTRSKWENKQQTYKEVMVRKSENKRMFQKQIAYGEGEKVGRMLAYIVRASASPSAIPAIRTMGGEISSVTEEISNTFKEYYEDLYKSRGGCGRGGNGQFLQEY